ncbi:EAL and HDOD domain-containing protein [Desulfosediminicola flagellatus]|uniref:EAL and HDOD domain-containing protein n=1 Tax=Desulfosediminicola flagellatus TaxID=2569541 RepID=UPI0010AC94F6|nr:HDOD domain-containing protein [Desulfosediminicola flagellatus]
MDFYIARQPIFTIHRKLYAYELLYRGTKETTLTSVNGERATTSLLSSAFLTEGIEIISGTKPCFINFTEDLIVKKIPLSFAKRKVVIEVLEDVMPTPEVIDACRFMHKQGYTIALDDFIYDKSLDPLIELADIIKIDFRLTPVDTLHKMLYQLRRFNVKLLAEKVETIDEFSKASKMGFSYFQGFFFSKPENIKIKELAATQISMVHLLAEVTQKTTTLERLHKIISVDVAISYKLLRFLNSAYFYRLQKVKTVKHAIAYLGEKELRRFIILIIISELASDKPDELIRMALVRAKFCELLGEEATDNFDTSELFMMGLFSFIDVMLDTPMNEIMDKLPLSPNVQAALTSQLGPYAIFLDIVQYYERGKDRLLSSNFSKIGVDENHVADMYLKALQYSNGLS